MFLGAYDFDGDPGDLLPAYERLAAAIPGDASELHVCIVRDEGLTVYDTCPTRDVFVAFSSSAGFLGAVRSAGLPEPTVRPLGDVTNVRGSLLR